MVVIGIAYEKLIEFSRSKALQPEIEAIHTPEHQVACDPRESFIREYEFIPLHIFVIKQRCQFSPQFFLMILHIVKELLIRPGKNGHLHGL